MGALAALRGPQDAVDEMVAEFRARRDIVLEGLSRIPGISCHRPSGAFYVFPDVSGTGLDGATFAERLLLEAGVCLLPGTAFGAHATDHVRISYATSREQLAEAIGRIGRFVAGL
jgi:aspartate/methionine/tyrosine aminotransferase